MATSSRAGLTPSRRAILRSIGVGALFAPTVVVRAQPAWPQRPVRMFVPFAAGGNIDVMGRLTAARLSEVFNQQFIVENRVGGGGIVASEAVARAQPDGYTMLWASTNVIAILPAMGKVPYDPVRDFAPVSVLGVAPQVLLVNAQVPAQNVAQFVAWVKAQPGKIAYAGGGGPGSASNLIMALFLRRADLDMTGVSYRGTAPAMNDLIAGHIPTMFIPLSEAHAQIDNPNVRMLAVSSRNRSRRVPDVPTIAESGYPDFDASTWTGMLAPAATPRDIVERVGAEMTKAVADPKFAEQLVNNGVEPLAEGPDRFAAMIEQEIRTWAEAVRIAGVKL